MIRMPFWPFPMTVRPEPWVPIRFPSTSVPVAVAPSITRPLPVLPLITLASIRLPAPALSRWTPSRPLGAATLAPELVPM